MGQPAARIGDTCSHGGAVVVGCPTVLIGGMPAARMGDMHVCPMVTPGVPPIPHVGMPIIKGSMGVLIGGMPAARMGDMATCVGPPDTILMGCMTVLIGETMAGGGGGGGAGGAAPGMGSAAKAALASAAMAGSDPQPPEGESHALDVAFQDKDGLPVGGLNYTMKPPDGATVGGVLGGGVKRTGVAEGSYEIKLRGIVNAQWDKQTADVGDKVKLIVETAGVDSGEKVALEVYVKDGNYTDHLLTTLETKVSNDKAQVEWTLEVDEKYLTICADKSKRKRYSQPFFYFIARAAELVEKSGILRYEDTFGIRVRDEDGNAIPNRKVRMQMPSGEVRETTSDADGKVSGTQVAPGQVRVNVDMR